MADAVLEPEGSTTRERILTAAAATLSQRGYARSHLADIARSARVQPPAVYYYFDSREDLIAAVMAEGQRLVREHVLAALHRAGADAGARARVAAAVEAHLRVELELSDFARAVSRNAGHLPAALRSELEQDSRAFHDIWRDLLHEAGTEGLLHPGLDPGVARMLAVGALNWASEWSTDTTEVDRVVKDAVRFVDSALFVRPT